MHELQLLATCAAFGRAAHDRASVIVEPEHFAADLTRRTFRAMALPDVTDDAGNYQFGAVAAHMGGTYSDALAWLMDLDGHGYDFAGLEHYARSVRRAAQLRELKALCAHTAAAIDAADRDATPAGIADTLIEQALTIGESRTATTARHIREGMRAMNEELRRRYVERDMAPRGFQSGLKALDALVTFEPGHVVLVGASSGHGKTAFLTHLFDASGGQKCSVLGVTCEVPEVDLLMRTMASATGVNSRAMSTGHFEGEDVTRIGAAMVQRRDRDAYILDAPATTVAAIEREVRRTVRRPGNRDAVAVLFVDYLQLIRPTERHGNREQDVAEVADALLELTKRHNLVTVVAAQLNRAGAARSDKRPVSSDLRESSRMEHNASVVLMLYRPALHGEDRAGEHACEVIVRKNRKGPLGTANVIFKPETNRWTDVERRFG